MFNYLPLSVAVLLTLLIIVLKCMFCPAHFLLDIFVPDSDEKEFEDDSLLQVLRKQRKWVKEQIR